ncbi:MAG: DUF2163 domain-containing protein [Pseudomonadota bacterium]
MRAVPSDLQAHLDEGTTTLCRCWRLVRSDGVTMGFTDHDREVSFDSMTFSAVDGLTASGDVAKAGLGVGGLEVEGALSSSALSAVDLQSGRYDGAKVTLYLVNWNDPAQRMVLRAGTLGEVTRVDGAFRAEVRGPLQALETIRGRVVTKTCDADLGDGRCGVNLSALTREATVLSVDGARVVVSGLDDLAAGWASGGAAVATTGSELGARRIVHLHTVEPSGVVLTLREPMVTLTQTHTLDVTPGCDKRFGTCVARFGNALNFQGFPNLPGNDRAFSYAKGEA